MGSNILQRIKKYREEVLSYLKQTNNHYETAQLNLKIDNIEVKYHRWLHPWQGDWEI